jgi:3',5'-cyclic AMP phosphodiesterase CpdA
VRRKLADLGRFAMGHDIDAVLATGDFTVLGSEAELRAARLALDPLTQRPKGFYTTPGNHDLYMPDTARERRFERAFRDVLPSQSLGFDLPEGLRVAFPDDGVAVISVRSARPNPQPWRSSGRIGAERLDVLERVLGREEVRGRFVFLLTHYAPRLADGRPDSVLHGLEDGERFLRVIADLPRAVVLHGHVHRCFRLALPGVRPTIFGAGSTTQDGGRGSGSSTWPRRGPSRLLGRTALPPGRRAPPDLVLLARR